MSKPEVRVLAAGSALPGPAVDNAALARRFNMDASWEQWVDVFIGTRSRHLAVDLESGEIRSSLAELGTEAAQRALDAAGLRPDDVDVMVLGTATPDQLMPATVNMIAERLGINDIATYQLQSGCTGAVGAMDLGRQMLLTGEHRTALVLGGDVCAKHFDVDFDLKNMAPTELVNVVLFGDGAGAAVLTTEPVADAAVMHEILNRLTGLGRPPGQVVDWYGQANRRPGESALQEDYKAIEQLVPGMAMEVLKELLDRLGWTETEVDYLLPPQLSGTMTPRIVAELGLPGAEEISVVTDIANTGNAAPFIQLEHALPEMVSGDRAIGIAIESSKWIKAGFALGKV
ncbi:3-oxoacyl-ACP synthase III family protein [Streptomyces sp. NPDC006617]|uniref:3-oxoacyl-ACP synthase III family protein n=1 Tax=Streptomyces sp. NPDC006617 TaxID=3155354 RepID=UPI00339DC060